MNYLNRQGVDASAVFAQVMRVYHDTTTILDILNIIDNTVPPKKNEDSKPIDSFINAQKLMKHIKKLQRMADIVRTDFSGLRKDTITAEDTLILVGMVNSEFQIIKSYLELKHDVTPAAKVYNNKTPSDVEQLIGWTTRRINLIKDLEAE